ncbi:AEC family transporter [Thermotoga neapolitana]|uniref:AEC family transporter n=1 Tax=Thermotoga neapolitana TaxID=2337 RepID=UPI001E3B41B0|nr:AEC family transporter [Thermotoga neapolitana]
MEFPIVILIGYLTKRFFEKETGKILSKLVVNFTLPAAVFYSLTTARFHFSKFAFTATGVLSNLVLISVALLVFSRIEDPRVRIPIVLSFVGFNTGLFMYSGRKPLGSRFRCELRSLRSGKLFFHIRGGQSSGGEIRCEGSSESL